MAFPFPLIRWLSQLKSAYKLLNLKFWFSIFIAILKIAIANNVTSQPLSYLKKKKKAELMFYLDASLIAQLVKNRLPSRGCRFVPWVGKILWRKWQPTPVFFHGKFHGQREAWRATVLSRSVVSDSLRPHGRIPMGDSPGKNTGVGCHAFLQGIFPTQWSNPCLPTPWGILQARILDWVAMPSSRASS